MIEFTRSLLKRQGGNALIEKMDARFAAIPRFHGLKIFHNGLILFTKKFVSRIFGVVGLILIIIINK